MLHRSYLCSIVRPAIHSHPKNRHAVPSPRISEWTRVDMTRSTLPRTHSVTEAAAPTTVVAAASPCPLDKSGSISDIPRESVVIPEGEGLCQHVSDHWFCWLSASG